MSTYVDSNGRDFRNNSHAKITKILLGNANSRKKVCFVSENIKHYSEVCRDNAHYHYFQTTGNFSI